jgi:gluconokinase
MGEQSSTWVEETQNPPIPLLVVLCGPSGSGKTTIGKALSTLLNWPWVDADDWHTPEARAKMQAGQALSDADRLPWLDRLNALGKQFQDQKTGWVLSCSALKQTYRQRLCHGLNPPPMLFWLKVSRTELARRLQQRSHAFFPAALLDSQLEISEVQSDVIVISGEQPIHAVAREIWAQIAFRFPSANT